MIDADVESYFDTIDHKHLRDFLDLRIRDGIIRRMIDKWLKAGVLDKGVLQRTEAGAPQGCVVSPSLFQYLPAPCAGRVDDRDRTAAHASLPARALR